MIYPANKIWFTSDTHFNHANICKATSKWDTASFDSGHLGVRDFSSLYEMNQQLISNINLHVAKDDYLFHLGDWSFGGIEFIFEFRKNLRCENIYLILGNHDQHILNNKELPTSQQEEALKFLNLTDKVVRTRDLFTSVDKQLEIKVQVSKREKAKTLFLSHYSHRVWNNHHKGNLHLFGHSHGSLDYFPNGKSMDVGIDVAKRKFNKYRPFKYAEVLQICNKNDIQILDHHV